MKKRVFKIALAVFLCVIIIGGLVVFCGASVKDGTAVVNATEKQADDEAEGETFTIGLCLSSDEEYDNYITQGFLDAVYDTIGKENVKVTQNVISESLSGEVIVNRYISKNMDMIFADGKAALSSASIATTEIPIVAAGVIDFKTTLHILDKNWDRYTARNVTGISGSPSVSNQLSLLIESTKNLKAVGILYTPEDTDSIYQNEILERYLNQAGIPWKEYELKSSDSAYLRYEEVADSYGSVITPGEISMASAKEGTGLNLESLGEDGVITEILSPDSARSPKVSKFWTADMDVQVLASEESVEEDAEVDAEEAEIEDMEIDTDTEELPIDYEVQRQQITEENAEIVERACMECNALYIAADSNLTDQIERITSIAADHRVTTLGGDMTLGEHTLVTLYHDPYDMGYRAGKLAKRILVDEKDPGEIRIGLPSSDGYKLYQKDMAQKLGIDFPKSFTEYDDFMEIYEVGAETERVVNEE